MYRVLLIGTIIVFGSGCNSSSSGQPGDWHQLHKDCVEGIAFVAHGGSVCGSITFREGCDNVKLAKRIGRGLKEPWPPSGAWPYNNMQLLQPEITEREFWALALAGLTGREFTVRAWDSEEARQARLRAFLRELP